MIQTYVYYTTIKLALPKGKTENRKKEILQEETASTRLYVAPLLSSHGNVEHRMKHGTFQYIPLKSEIRTIESADVGWEVCKSTGWILHYS